MAHALNVSHNIAAINTRRHMSATSNDLGTRLERLSSGLRINGADDDAAGLCISEGFRAQITGLSMGVRNAEQGANMVQVAEGSLNEVSSMLIRLRELAVQASSSTVNDPNRESIDAEVNQIKQEIDRIAHSTVYNGQSLLTGFGNIVDDAASSALTASATTGVTMLRVSGAPEGTYTLSDTAGDSKVTLGNGVVSQTITIGTLLDQNGAVTTGTTAVLNFDRLGVQLTLAGHGVADATGSYVDGDLDGMTIQVNGGTGGSFQVGANDVAADRIEVNMGDMRASGNTLNLNTISLGTQSGARAAITRIDLAIDKVSNQRGLLGATMNRLQHTISFTDNSIENNTNSEATLRDADIAAEVTQLTRAQILAQSGTAMLSQAHAKPQAALSLLQ
jgi:flagellin